MILPFVDDPPPWHFGAGADSISISGHKMIGSPLPCGVAMVRRTHMERISRSVEYVGALDTTISGSRSAITPLMLWYAFRAQSDDAFRELVGESLQKAAYVERALHGIGVEAWRNPYSVTVVFPRPPAAILKKWILSSSGNIAHLIALPGVSWDTLDEFIDDMQREIGTAA
jgi:histidine decarboxylase